MNARRLCMYFLFYRFGECPSIYYVNRFKSPNTEFILLCLSRKILYKMFCYIFFKNYFSWSVLKWKYYITFLIFRQPAQNYLPPVGRETLVYSTILLVYKTSPYSVHVLLWLLRHYRTMYTVKRTYYIIETPRTFFWRSFFQLI